jgi:hypothetical protein
VVKQIWTGLFVTGATFFASQLSAQSAKPVSLDLAVGAAIPVGDFSNGFNTGYNGTAGLELTSIGSPVGIRLEGMYNHFGGRTDLVQNQPDARIIAGTANLVYNLPGQGIRPYLIGGAGYYGLKLDLPNAASTNKFGLNGGVGAVFPLSGFNTFVEARLHHVFTDNSSTQFIPVVFGIQF